MRKLGYHTPSRHPIPRRVLVRIWDRVDVRSLIECWPWKLSVGSHGYGQVGWWRTGGGNAMTTAHRAAWTALFGPLPVGMTVDHRCKNPVCCNPCHLRLRTNPDNARDNRQAQRGRGRRSYKDPV